MRFLQTEWHRHERDRNAWDIERAEMKARIARMEGENRTSKKLQDSLTSHIKMLEHALKRERERSKAGASGGGGSVGGSSGSHESTADATESAAPVGRKVDQRVTEHLDASKRESART